MSRLFIKPKLLKGKAGESICRNLEVANVQIRNQKWNPGYIKASGHSAFSSMAFQISRACSVNDSCQHLSLPLFAPFSSGNIFAVHLVCWDSFYTTGIPSNFWDQVPPARSNISYPQWIWVTGSITAQCIHSPTFASFIPSPSPFSSTELAQWVSSPASPCDSDSSDNQAADSPPHVGWWPCLKSIMSNITPPVQLHCCWLSSDKPWRSEKT